MLGPTTGPTGGSCFQEKVGTCSEYPDHPTSAQRSCKILRKGTYATESCPSANVMGVCEQKRAKKYFYFGGAYPWVADAKDACEKDLSDPGKFTPSANAEAIAREKALPVAQQIGGSCTTSTGACEDLTGEHVDMHKAICDRFGGKFSAAPCSGDKLVASCLKSGKVERFYENDLKGQRLGDLEQSCALTLPFGHFYSAAPRKSEKSAAVAATPTTGTTAKATLTAKGGAVRGGGAKAHKAKHASTPKGR
jgi:hypothetical protein